MKKWILQQGNRSRAPELAQKLGISPLTAAVLLTKGFESGEALRKFAAQEPDFTDPMLIRDMDKAVERIERAVEEREKICIYGDYDADGVTSTAIMYLYLKSIWCDVMFYIPDRESEGYGMNKNAVRRLHDEGVSLIITVDNGVSAYDEVLYASELGIDTVITDHHAIPKRMPKAVAVVDPHRKDDESPFKDFSGVGVAFKLIMALERGSLDIDDLLDRYSDICAIGTIADVVSLTGENRMLVREGLRRINDKRNIGIKALCEMAGCGDKTITSGDVGFIIAPRINAVGRLDVSSKSVELLVTDDEKRAEEIAGELCRDNVERKTIQQEICAAARKMLDENEDIRVRKVLVVAGRGWHQGVIGLAASNLKELYGKPTIVISIDGDSAKGSARSVEGFPMNEAVSYCSELLTVFGGHPMAAGMSMPAANVDAFREKINQFAETLGDAFYPVLPIAARIKPGIVTPEDVDSLKLLEPYGAGNTKPIFAYGGVTIDDVVSLKGGKFIRLLFSRDGMHGSAVSFDYSYADFPYRKGDVTDIAVDLKINNYNGRSVDPQLREIKFTDADNGKLMHSKRVFEEYRADPCISDEKKLELSVKRDDFIGLYTFLKRSGDVRMPAEILYHRLNTNDYTLGGLLVMLTAMHELGLASVSHDGELLEISLAEDPPKVDLSSAPVLSGIKAAQTLD